MLLKIIWLLIIVSLEATLGLPLFFVYVSDRFLQLHTTGAWRIFGLFIVGFCLAVFYLVSWPLVVLLLLVWHIVGNFKKMSLVGEVSLYVLLQIVFFFMSSLIWNYFYFVHVLLFAWYLTRTSLRKYAK